MSFLAMDKEREHLATIEKGIKAREFTKAMENLINSPNQKLIGDLNIGFVYADKQSKALKSAVNAKYGVYSTFAIKKVIFNEPATIVFWEDSTKTVVRAENENFDPEKGLAMAIVKKVYGNKGSYFNQIRKWTESIMRKSKNGWYTTL